jgi:hypothetical protein
MSAKLMDVFSLRDTVVGEYRKFATSFTTIFADDLRKQIDAIYADERYWPEPLIQINPNLQARHDGPDARGRGRARAGVRRHSAPGRPRRTRAASRDALRCTMPRRGPGGERRAIHPARCGCFPTSTDLAVAAAGTSLAVVGQLDCAIC